MIKRRAFLAHLSGGIVSSAALAAEAVAAPLERPRRATATTSPADSLFATAPMLWAPRADGAEVLWTVPRLSRGRVELRKATGETRTFAGDDFGFVPQSAGVMRVRLEGLDPGTEYEWRAVTEAIDGDQAREESAWKRFRTLDPNAAETTFCVWNDTHERVETIRKLYEVTPQADFLLWNGDTCNDWHEEEILVPTLLAPGGLDISEKHPLLLTFGNHDVRGKYGFRVPEHIATPAGRPYYAFRSGPVAIVALHTGEDKPDDHPSFHGRVAFQALREEQAAWLAQTLRRPELATAPYRVVFCHIPLRWIEEPEQVDYAGGGFDHYARSSRDLWHRALVDWGAQVVISGHTHRPASIAADAAFPYAQMIGGGPQLERATWTEAKADARALTITIRSLSEGKVLHQESFAPLT